MMTDKQRQTLAELNSSFVQSISIASDATAEEVRQSGWSRKGKEAWIAAIVADYRVDVRELMGD